MNERRENENSLLMTNNGNKNNNNGISIELKSKTNKKIKNNSRANIDTITRYLRRRYMYFAIYIEHFI